MSVPSVSVPSVSDPSVHSQWGWTDGTAWDYNKWGLGQPDNQDGNENFVEMSQSNGYWNDNKSEDEHPFVCQRKVEKNLLEV